MDNVQFINRLKERFNFKIINKSSSKLMKLLSFILFFNKNFDKKFVTTIKNTIYVPDNYDIYDDESVIAIAHECVHIVEINNILTMILYLFPQVLAVFFVLLFPFIGFYSLIFLLFMMPFPAYWRMKYELNGYTMSLFVVNELLSESYDAKARIKFLKTKVKFINNVFTSSDYYYMWPFGIEDKLNFAAEKIISGEILKNKLYKEIKELISQSQK